MKAKYVPITRVSVDPEIQRMRDMLTSTDDLVIDADGTISRAGSVQESNPDTKAKTVPKAIVSVPDSGRSVQDLIKEMRGEEESTENSEVEDVASENISTGKTSIVPKGIVSATSVSDLINEMRGVENTEEGNAEVESEEEIVPAEPKTKIVPKGIVSNEREAE